MDSFVKKIFEKKVDYSVHSQLIRFGKGVFGRRSLLNLRRGTSINLSGSFEFSNDFVDFAFENSENLNVSGILLSREEKNFKGGKLKNGIYIYEISKEMTKEEFKGLKEKVYFMLFDCETPGIKLKIKKKLPRPSKSEKKKLDDKFCSLEINESLWLKLHSSFLFDVPLETKRVKIEHRFEINEIILPKDETNPVKMRENALRKGKIIRSLIINKKELLKSAEFEA